MMKKTQSNGKMDYDEENDILFFRVHHSQYIYSIESDNLVIDIDVSKRIIAIQLFEASEMLGVSPSSIQKMIEWKIHTRVREGRLLCDIFFSGLLHNTPFQKTVHLSKNVEDVPDQEDYCILMNSEILA